MPPSTSTSPSRMLTIIGDALTGIAPQTESVDAHTSLLGAQAVLDSTGFVTLLISLEQNLGGAVDLAASFMEVGDVEEASNPFQTVGSLANHINALLTSAGALPATDRKEEQRIPTGG
jgi:hypothetical protein